MSVSKLRLVAWVRFFAFILICGEYSHSTEHRRKIVEVATQIA